MLATDFIAEAIERNCALPHTVHADRGTSMTSKPVAAMLGDLGFTRYSRPWVRGDSPLAEAQFKPLKYLPEFPSSFTSLARDPVGPSTSSRARQFCAGFFHEYNYIHHLPGIAWHTPPSVHFGTSDAIDPRAAEHADRGLPRPPREVRPSATPAGDADPALDQPSRPEVRCASQHVRLSHFAMVRRAPRMAC